MSANTTHRTIFYKFSPFHPLLTHLSPTATITLTTTLPLSQRKEHLMAKEQIAVAELITNIILGKTDGASRVDFFPQKPKFPFDKPYEQPFPRATPESQCISSDMLADLLRDLDTSHYTDMHHFMVLRNGKVICEANFAPYRSRIWHVTHSMCKSITGMAIGLLVEEGRPLHTVHAQNSGREHLRHFPEEPEHL